MQPDPQEPASETPIHGVLCVEGVETGDYPRRIWAPGSLTWDSLPLPFKWQPAEDHGHNGAVVSGRIDEIWRDGALIRFIGVLDSGGFAGLEVERLLAGRFLRGVSILADDISDLDIELVYAPPPLAALDIAAPPIEVDAVLETAALDDEMVDDVPLEPVAPDEKLDDDPNLLPSDEEGMALDIMPEIMSPEPCLEIYHAGRIRSATVVPEAAFVEAVVELGPSPITPGSAPAVEEAIVLDQPAAMTAAAYTITIPEIWPESWFTQPTDAELALCASGGGAVQITRDGRVFGLLAPAGVQHRAFRTGREKVTAPRGIDYSEWQNKAALVAGADGEVYKIPAGTVTYDCGHASPVDPRRADPSWATQHYDNSCSVAMRARAGEHPQYGTWFAGALAHGLTADAVERIMGCALSGDWQGGKLKAALLVPCEGFPVSSSASVRVRDGALVASSVPLHLEGLEPEPDVSDAFDFIASAIGRDPESRFDQLLREIGRA